MIKKLLFAVWIIVLVGVGYYFYTHDISLEQIQEYVAGFGLWGILVYMLAYTIRPLIFFPTSVMTPASVALFGPGIGWITTYIGETFSACLAFFVARFFGRKFVKSHENKFLKKYDKKLTENGLETVVFLRLVPLFPFDFVNYSSGLSGIKFRAYIIGTMVGIIPGLTAYIFLGASIASDPWFILPTVLMFLLLALLAKKLQRKKK